MEISENLLRRYSLRRAIDVTSRGQRLDGLERELSDEASKDSARAEGFKIPWEVLASRTGRRDLTAGTFGSGGAFIPTVIYSPIELLRNRTVCLRAGAQLLNDLQGSVAIPRQTAPATAVALPESQTLTKSTQAIDQVILNPHRVGAWTEYSRQLILQSSVDVEDFVREDIMRVVALKWDYLMLNGGGSNSEPTGVLNTAGIGSILFGGSATWASMIAFETALANANADVEGGKFAYITSPSVKSKLKAAPKIGSTFPIFIFEDGDAPDGKVNGYRAGVSNQILNNQVFFGQWRDLVFGSWSSPDCLVNPFSRDTDAVIRITCNTFVDCCIRHAASFCVSGDAGNQ